VGLSTVIIDDESDLGEIRSQWDALAVKTGKPFSAPAWVLAWWRNVHPKSSGMRVVAVRDGSSLVGLAPLYATRPKGSRSAYEVMAARLSPPASLLVEPSRKEEVCGEVMRALAEAQPKPRSLRLWDQVDPDGFAKLLAKPAPGPGAWIHATPPAPLPLITLEGLSYDDWFGSLSSKFRQEARRRNRRLEDAGARFCLAEEGDLDRVLDAFVELHGARWDDRGGSSALVPGLKAMLAEAAAELLPGGRMRIFTIEVEGRTIAANILVAAGGEVNGWSSGFDDDWGRFSPSIQLTLHAVADAAERGDRLINMGPGRMSYKARLADAEEQVALTSLVPRDSAYPVSRLWFAPHQLRTAVSRRLSDDTKLRLRRLARR
jgi:CelD/BcsL family acetyltransferase involved in cellulose biosynthesis